MDDDPRRGVSGGVLRLKDVEFADTAVYQCEATNKHGSILLNTYLYVVGKYTAHVSLCTSEAVCTSHMELIYSWCASQSSLLRSCPQMEWSTKLLRAETSDYTVNPSARHDHMSHGEIRIQYVNPNVTSGK